jgi:hypothetical protein
MYKPKPARSIAKPEPVEADYSSHNTAPAGEPAPKDGFVSTRNLASHEKREKPGVKAKDLSGSLKETHGAAGATEWEQGGEIRSLTRQSVRSQVQNRIA